MLIAIATGGLLPVGIILLMALGMGGGKKGKRTKSEPKGECAPFPWLPERVDEAVASAVAAGLEDPTDITLTVLREVYPDDPEGTPLTWPVPDSGDAARSCIQDRVRIRVDRRLAELVDEIADEIEEEAQQESSMPEVIRDYEPVSGDGNRYPAPSAFYRVNPPGTSPLTGGKPENLTIIAKAALMNALQMADLDPAMADGDDQFARNLRVGMMNAIECSPWNDALYGHESSHHYSPHPRGISLNAVHADNRTRLIRGEKPRRSVTGEASHDGTGGHLPYLWIPAVDPDALELGVVKAVDSFWPNGDSGSWPPTEVSDLNGENIRRGPWGCEGEVFPRDTTPDSGTPLPDINVHGVP